MSESQGATHEPLHQGMDIETKFTGSQINYYFICTRKLWLFSHNIELEPESDLVKLGALLHENSYKRKMKEVQIDRIKVDFMESKKIQAPPLNNIEENGQNVEGQKSEETTNKQMLLRADNLPKRES